MLQATKQNKLVFNHRHKAKRGAIYEQKKKKKTENIHIYQNTDTQIFMSIIVPGFYYITTKRRSYHMKINF